MLRIVHLYYDLMEIEPLKLEDWIEGFWIDEDPEKEIRAYETVLFVIRKLDATTKLTLDVQTHSFRALTSILTDHRSVDPKRGSLERPSGLANDFGHMSSGPRIVRDRVRSVTPFRAFGQAGTQTIRSLSARSVWVVRTCLAPSTRSRYIESVRGPEAFPVPRFRRVGCHFG